MERLELENGEEDEDDLLLLLARSAGPDPSISPGAGSAPRHDSWGQHMRGEGRGARPDSWGQHGLVGTGPDAIMRRV